MRNNLHILKSIEHRILFSLIIIGLVPLIVSIILNNIIIADSLFKLEKENLHALGNRTKTIIEEKLNQLGTISRDYSIWDDAYNKSEIKDHEWFKKNFSGWLPENFNVDLSVVINNNKEVIDEFGLSSNNISQLLEVENISDLLKAPNNIDRSEYPKGIFIYNGEPYLYTASPMLKSYYKGESKGILIIGKKISSSYIEEIANRLGQRLFMTFGNKVVYSDDNHKNIDEYISIANTQQDIDSVKFINNELVGSTDFGSIPNVGQVKLSIIMRRDTFLNARKKLDISSGAIMWLSFISILIMSLLLKKKTTFPLKDFENQIYKMSQHNIVSYVKTEGPDEVEKLTEAFNKMVCKINEQSIENQNLRTELEYDRLKNEFLTNISHEFRTPLNVILGSIQLQEIFLKNVLDDKIAKSIGKNVHVMRQNCFRLLRLINNLIDLTKIRSNAFQVHLGNYNIISLIEDITLSVAEYTESKGIFVGFDTDTEEKIMACDPDQIERILLNLLSNSIKFTKPGGEIWVITQDKQDSLLITVKDTGIGIPQDQLEEIFERFKQVDKSLTRVHEGSGIGLSLVKSLVEMHQGSIHVESEYGKGSEFIIELPANALSEISEDNETNNYIIQNKVERLNIEFSDIYS